MRELSKAVLQGRNSRFKSVFLLLFAGSLACVAESQLPTPLLLDGVSEPNSELAAETPAEPAVEPELFMLLSTDDNHFTIPALLAAPNGEPIQPKMAAEIATEEMRRMREKPAATSVSLARVHMDAFKENHVGMFVSPTKRLRASKKHFEATDENNFVWSGEVPGAAARSTFVVRDGKVTGNIRDENNVLYHIEPVGDGVHALTEIDETLLPPLAKPVALPEVSPADANGLAPAAYLAPAMAAASGNPVVVDVLVAFTPAARRLRSDMDALIRLAIEETHRTYENSGINIRLNLVDSFEFDYTEQSDWVKMLEDFAASPTVNSRRNASGADVAMLIMSEARYCGMAYVLSNTPGWNSFESAYAFGLVDVACAAGYTFAHELGHIQGAQHNEHIATNKYFPYGHGYIYSVPARTSNFSTVMAYDWGAGCTYACPKIPYWSSPNVYYKGLPTGTAGTNDNVRVLNATASNVAAFKARAGGGGESRPTCTLSAQVSSIPNTGGTYSFTASCSGSPSSYTWTVNGQTQSSRTNSLSYNFPANNTSVAQSFTIAVTATNSAGSSSPAQLTLTQAAQRVDPPSCSPSVQVSSIPQAGGTYAIYAVCTNSPTSYTWTVNGQTQSERGSSLNYYFPPNETSSTRSFNIGFTAVNSAGVSNTVSLTLNQAGLSGSRPSCTFGFSAGSIPYNSGYYQITVYCTGSPSSYTWTVNGQTQPSKGNPIIHYFPANNTSSTLVYNIAVTATNSFGTSSPEQLTVYQYRR